MTFNPQDLKDAKIKTVTLDIERPITFDFNALAELQKIYDNPFEALASMEGMDLLAFRAVMWAALTAGEMAITEKDYTDLTVAKVGRLITPLLAQEGKMLDMVESIMVEAKQFFPDIEEKEEEKKPVKATTSKKTTTKAKAKTE